MGLGATGLALKTVITQCIMVNLLLWFASRLIPLHFIQSLISQVLILGSFLILAFAGQKLSVFLFPDFNMFARFFLSGVFYTGMSVFLALSVPMLFGCTRQELKEAAIRIHLIKKK